MTKGDQHFSIRDPTPEESENCAKECEEWCKVFPVFFPNRNITRKMIEYSLVLPRFIREKKGLLIRSYVWNKRGRDFILNITTLKTHIRAFTTEQLGSG